MRLDDQQPLARTVALGVAGPVAAGAILGVPFGPSASLSLALSTPAIVIGTAAVMAPALYVGLTVMGSAPPARQVVARVLGALRAMGVALLGLAPALAFLVATVSTPLEGALIVSLGLAVGVFLGVRALLTGLVPTPRGWARALPVLLVWTPVSLGLGVFFYVSTLITVFKSMV